MVRLRRLIVLAALVLLAACGGAATISPTDGTASATAAAEVPSEEAPPHILSGTFETVAGPEIDLAEFQGKDVVLWFWAPW